MVVSITQIVVVAVIGFIIAGVWLLRRALSGDENHTKKLRCRACGQSSSGGANFCGHCGARLT